MLEGQSWREGMGLIASLFLIRTHTNSACGILVNVFENFLPERRTVSSNGMVYDGGSILLLLYGDLCFF